MGGIRLCMRRLVHRTAGLGMGRWDTLVLGACMVVVGMGWDMVEGMEATEEGTEVVCTVVGVWAWEGPWRLVEDCSAE